MQSKSRIHASPPLPPDQFDRLPDSLALLILTKLADARSLLLFSSVSKRLHSLVPLVPTIHLTLPNSPSLSPSPKPPSLLSRLLLLLLQPFRNPNPPLLPHPSPSHLLTPFSHIRHLRIELPSADVSTDDGLLLRWHAEFGSSLHNCVILAGTPVHNPSHLSSDDTPTIPNGGLKLRVVWTISSLIAASTRHYFLRPIIKSHPTLRSLVLTDGDGQGTLSMGEEQLREFREKPLAAAASGSRTQVPASSLKLRYAPCIELADGVGMQGATLVAIRASGEGEGVGGCRKEAEAFVSGAFDGAFRDAVKMLLKRRTYLLEMNGF